MNDWINYIERRPTLFGKYFVKINGIKQLISFHEFDFYYERGEEILWLEDSSTVSRGVISKVAEFDPFKHIALELHYKKIYDVRVEAIKWKEEVEKQKEEILKLNLKIDALARIIEIQKEELTVLEEKMKPEDLIRKSIDSEKSLTQKLLKEKFSHAHSCLNFSRVKKLFPELKDQSFIPLHLREEMIKIYTSRGVEIIESRMSQNCRKKNSISKVENKSESVAQLTETMNIVGIEFEPVLTEIKQEDKKIS